MDGTFPYARRAAAPGASRRRKLWELDPRLHCSVIGTCLDLDALRRIGSRAGIPVGATVTDYELHHAFVRMAERPLPAVRLLHKCLERTHRRTVARFAEAGDERALAALWAQARDSGDVAGGYWALLTHPAVTDGLVERASGEVHMLSHQAGAARCDARRRLQTLQRRTESLHRKLAETRAAERRRVQAHQETIERLRQRLRLAQQAERETAALRQRLANLESGAAIIRLREQLERYAAELAQVRLRAERAEARLLESRAEEARARELERTLADVRAERDALEAFVQSQLQPREGRRSCGGEPCPLPDLCGRCVLYVGGRAALNGHLAALVAHCNGTLLYHDGGREQSPARLVGLLPRADAVLCPVDCISHDAYRRIKQFCKRSAKRLVLLPSASLPAFARGLHQLDAGAG